MELGQKNNRSRLLEQRLGLTGASGSQPCAPSWLKHYWVTSKTMLGTAGHRPHEQYGESASTKRVQRSTR